MASCEMCGREGDLTEVDVEGTNLEVCKNCLKFGKQQVKPAAKFSRAPNKFNKTQGRFKQRRTIRPEVVEVIIKGYGDKVSKVRSKMGLTQEEFARKLNEKESLISKIENNQFEPSIILAKKLETILKIKLIEVQEETKAEMLQQKASGKGLTIADFIKVRKK
ncbi:TIGR00270 family protein [Candidatus Woesearchaeota archaeon]|jgi:putative transcription factor|nr:TIGR00270 family protein [Candidatus Woesearchaeota archaeon]